MKELTLTIPIRVFSYEELDEADRHLIDTAREATRRSYAPYSRFAVGAALRLIDGTTRAIPTKRWTPWPLPQGMNGASSSPTPYRRAARAGK